MKIYVNGRLDASKAYTLDTIGGQNDALYLGAYTSLTAEFLDGKEYLFLLYDRQISDDEVSAIYQNPLNPPTDGLILWLAPDSLDTENMVWTDKSGNGNDGTVYGATPVELRTISESTPSRGRPFILRFNGVDDGVIWEEFIHPTGPMSAFTFFTSWQYPNAHGNDPHMFIIGANAMSVIQKGDTVIEYRIRREDGIAIYDDVDVGPLTSISFAGITFDGKVKKSYFGVNVVAIRQYEGALLSEGTKMGVGNSVSRLWGMHGNSYGFYIYSRPLSPEEVATIYNDPENPPQDGLLLWLSPESYDLSAGKWLNRAPVMPHLDMVEAVDGVNYGADPIPVRYVGPPAYYTPIWDIGGLRLTYPWPLSISEKGDRRVVITLTLSNTPAQADLGYRGREVAMTWRVTLDEAEQLKELIRAGGPIHIIDPAYRYTGDYFVKSYSYDTEPGGTVIFKMSLIPITM